MGGKMVPKIILEGTRLTMKTEIAFALNEHPRIVGPKKYRYHSPLISAEWCSFSNYPWGKGPINFDPEDEGRAMEVYGIWARMFELQKYYSWIVDRFHISTIAYQMAHHGKRYDFGWLEDRLEPLGFRLVFMKRSEDSFQKAREERLKVSGNPAQYDDLDVFVDEQRRMEELVRSSKLKSLTVDISDGHVSKAVGDIADWLERTGGLYLE